MQKDLSRINALPTKELFIYVLTRDIKDVDVIADLVDNCVDGAHRLRPEGDYKGLFIKIEMDREHFSILDNCGGIPIELARNYAFRFGRARGIEDVMEETPNSIGQFGVGMKRALFRLGKFFRIESASKTSSFVMEQDVEAWLEDEQDWEFRFKDHQEALEEIPEKKRGTKIEVLNLYSTFSNLFGSEKFAQKLHIKLQSVHQQSIDSGLQISINGFYIEASPPTLLASKDIKPAYQSFEELDGQVSVRIYSGLSDKSPRNAGWNIYCNGRQILEADTSYTTGWGRDTPNPEYHNDFSRFRGYVYFDSNKADLLPWNTMKNDVDENSDLYVSVRQKMINLMPPIINFLYRASEEKSALGDGGPLEEILAKSKPCAIQKITQETVFTAPSTPSIQKMSTISYKKPKREAERVKKSLQAKTLSETGEKTFDYYVQMEVDD